MDRDVTTFGEWYPITLCQSCRARVGYTEIYERTMCGSCGAHSTIMLNIVTVSTRKVVTKTYPEHWWQFWKRKNYIQYERKREK